MSIEGRLFAVVIQQLERGAFVNALQVAETWAVGLRTARRDIAALKRAGKIQFVGGKRNGTYAMPQI